MPDLPDSKVHAHPHKEVLGKQRPDKKKISPYHPIATSPYAELAVTSNFTFLTGASHPDEYVYQAAQLGYGAIALTDRNSLAGVVRAHVAAKDAGIPFVVGCRLEINAETPKRGNAETLTERQQGNEETRQRKDTKAPATTDRLRHEGTEGNAATPKHRNVETQGALSVLVYPTDRASYGRLCRLLTLGKRRAEKGNCFLMLDDLLAYQEGLLAVIAIPRDPFITCPLPYGRGSVLDSVKIPSLPLLRDAFDDDRLSLALTHLYGPGDEEYKQYIEDISQRLHIPLVAINDVYYHIPERRALQDVMTSVRHHCTLAEAGFRLFPNGERYLKEPQEMVRLFVDHPEAIARTMHIAERAASFAKGNKATRQRGNKIKGTKARSHEATKGKTGFSLDQLRYEYPHETCPAGKTPMEHLVELTWQGAAERYPQGVPDKVRKQIEHEFTLIEELQYAPYFLTVHDLVKFARSRGILCQGRGAAANSAVCYCLGVTAVDPDRINLLFERFVSRERDEPPDIDIDFEHERREEVIQYIYAKYGRDRAGLTAEVITYRRRSAVRDVGKALGLSLDAVDRIAKRVDHWELNPFADSEAGDVPAQLAALGFDPNDATVRHFIRLVEDIAGFPRHLSQHVGGFVMTEGLLCESVPIENAAMRDRTVIEWDKDDIEALGMLKVDVLGLGMLTCITKALDFIHAMSGSKASTPAGRTEVARDFSPWKEDSNKPASGGRTVESFALRAENEIPAAHQGLKAPGNNHAPSGRVPSYLTLATIPPEDPIVYDMLCKADTVGVFQVESRAQMTMLPRLRPRCFYDLVIEVAIVRPGPIIGDMVHPYLRRRNGEEAFTYPTKVIEEVLGKTLGVPLFQEQVMSLAIRAAGFTAGEAERLRRAITAWTSKDDIAKYPARFIEGMLRNGYDRAFATWCFERMKGFSQYGFPESHAASFALLVYASAWIKCYYPAAFAAALLNSQPMGFYAPAQIIRDAQDHDVTVLPADVNYSEWNCTLEGTKARSHEATKGNDETVALRLGLRILRGLKEAEAKKIVQTVREQGAFKTPYELWRASEVSASTFHCLALGDAFSSMGLDRQHALWEVQQLHGRPLPLFDEDRPVGPTENNPAFQRWDSDAQKTQVPEGRLSSSIVPTGLETLDPNSPAINRWAIFKASLRDAGEEIVCLPEIPYSHQVAADYRILGFSLKDHPLSFLRETLAERGVITAAEGKEEGKSPFGRRVTVAGLVLFRQRPGTARGVMFMTLEDETGRIDLIVRPDVYEKFRDAAVYSKLVLARGRVERQNGVVHVLASAFESLDHLAAGLPAQSRDFR